MLPEFPEVTAEISEFFTSFLQDRIRYHQNLPPMRHLRMHEGDQSAIQRVGGERDETEFVTGRAEVRVAGHEVPSMSIMEILKRIDKMAAQLANQQVEQFVKSASTTIRKVGNTVDAKGGRLTPELFFEVLQKIHIPFDENGKHEPFHILAGCNAEKAWEHLFAQVENDPELQREYDNIMTQKREAHRAAEAARALVG